MKVLKIQSNKEIKMKEKEKSGLDRLSWAVRPAHLALQSLGLDGPNWPSCSASILQFIIP